MRTRLTLLLLLLIPHVGMWAAEPSKPNIVVFLADDKYYDPLGNAAEEAEHTENDCIDAFCKSPGIAADSVEFEASNYTLLQQVCFYRT